MYKTVRHGENSLQYTILPQQDDAAAMTTNSSVCGRSIAGVRRRARRGRTATILILTLILACGVVGAAVLVHVLISTDLISLPSALQRFRSNGNADHRSGHHSSHSLTPQKNKTTIVHQSTTPLLSVVSEDVVTSSSVTFDQSSTSVSPPPLSEAVIASTKAPVQVVMSTVGAGTTVAAQQQAPVEVGGLLEEDGGAKEHDHVGGSKKKALNEDVRNSTTRVFVSAAAGEDNSVLVLDVGRSTERPKHRSWLEPRWPFADPSSYLHWAGYNSRDSVLLPLFLGGCMLMVVLSTCLCYTMRRRLQKTIRRHTIGKMSYELQCGDKTAPVPDGSEDE